MRILQNYPIDDIQIVMNHAYSIRETRLQAIASGRIIPGVNDRRSSGMFSVDSSDAASISSTGSGSPFRKLRESTDMARASLDSLRRGSKESLDDLFKRGLNISRGSTSEELDRKRSSTGDMSRSISQKFGFMSNNLASKVKRASSVRSMNALQQAQRNSIEEQIHRDWLLANQLNEPPLLARQNSISSNASATRTSSLMNRFSQFVSNKSINPYQPPTKRTDSSSTTPTGDEKHVSGLSARELSAYRGYV